MKYLVKSAKNSTPIFIVPKNKFSEWVKKQKPDVRSWLDATGFKAEADKYAIIPEAGGKVAFILAVTLEKPEIWSIAALPGVLPGGVYHIGNAADFDAAAQTSLCCGWALGAYDFSRYKKEPKKFAALVIPAKADMNFTENLALAVHMARDMINTPAEDMGPAEISAEAKRIAREFKASFKEYVGDDLLKQNYPAVHAVGRAAAKAPRLIDITWGSPKHPKVTLVGKGVCFDSGGLDIKGASGMQLMKKDMGGAAAALALGSMIMRAGLPVRLRVLLPAVENAVSGNAFRPLDVLQTRKGLTVEVTNTDAEGRLILCDALAEADSEKPDLILDFATLTGAARVALGTEIPALFTPSDKLAAALVKSGEKVNDPLWRLPLWKGYRGMLDSKVADLLNASDSGYAGAITAALYLAEFVENAKNWAHIDMMAWNLSAKPGRPVGGEAMAIRAAFDFIVASYQ